MYAGVFERLNGVWGFAPDTVYAVGNQGRIVRYDGVNWNIESPPVEPSFVSVWGSSPEDVFAVGNSNVPEVVHWDGTEWVEMDPVTWLKINDVCGSAPDDVYLVGNGYQAQHYDGKKWNSLVLPQTPGSIHVDLFACWMAPNGDLWAVGSDGRVARYGFDAEE
jgi:hypothetical protein